MASTERRQKLLEVLCIRRHDTCDNLAHEFHVANSTIRRNLEILTCSYPIETVRGRIIPYRRVKGGYCGNGLGSFGNCRRHLSVSRRRFAAGGLAYSLCRG